MSENSIRIATNNVNDGTVIRKVQLNIVYSSNAIQITVYDQYL